jgi:hypothetical protein
MNESGSSSPQIGCCQPTSASAATMAPVRKSTSGRKCSSSASLSISPCRCSSMSLRKALLRDMSSVYSATWLPPPRLAIKTASSARRSRSVLLSRPGMPTATPMLTVRVIMWPPIARRSRSIALRRRANDSAPAVDIGWPGMTTNSSPPSRAIMLCLPAHTRIRCANILMNQSPVVWPR